MFTKKGKYFSVEADQSAVLRKTHLGGKLTGDCPS